MEGSLEGLVAHPRAAKGNAADIGLRVLQRSPSGTCTPLSLIHTGRVSKHSKVPQMTKDTATVLMCKATLLWGQSWGLHI